MGDEVRGLAACAALLAAASLTVGSSFGTRVQGCPAPRPTVWSAIRDTLWPLITHRDGDSAWAHLEPAGLPRESAAWCNPLAGDAAAQAAGRSLYGQYCATCHGDRGHGDGPGAGVSEPGPYDFTRPEFAGMREPPGPGVLYAILTRGVAGTMMRGFSDLLSGWERLALMAYIATLPGEAAVQGSRAWADTLRSRKRANSGQ